MNLHMVMYSEEALNENYSNLSMLDVRKSRASHPVDEKLILTKIGDLDAFNAHLQWSIFGTGGLLQTWKDGCGSAKDCGRIVRRILNRAIYHVESPEKGSRRSRSANIHVLPKDNYVAKVGTS